MRIPVVLSTKNVRKLEEQHALIDDTLDVGSKAFKLQEQMAGKTFENKQVEALLPGECQDINGSRVNNCKGYLLLNESLNPNGLK